MRLRFSLSTLLMATFFAGAAYRVWWCGPAAWNCERTFQTGTLQRGGGAGDYNVVALSCDGRILAATSAEHKLRIFSVLNGATLWTVELMGSAPHRQLRFIDADRAIEIQCSKKAGVVERVYYVDAHEATLITNAARLKELAALTPAPARHAAPHHDATAAAILSPDEKRSLQCVCDGKIQASSDGLYHWRLCSTETKAELAQLPDTRVPWGMRFSPDGKRFAVATFRQACVGANADGRILSTLETGRWNLHLEFSQDGELLAIAHPDSVSLWRRRWPEPWWGHFCRFEVWLAILTAGLLFWRLVVALAAIPRSLRHKDIAIGAAAQ
jgi:hypothetical protein